MTITNHVRKARWIHEHLWPDPDLQRAVERPPKDDGTPRYSADRATREFLLDALYTPEHAERFDDKHLDLVIDVLETIEAGNSAAVRKFTAFNNLIANDNRIHGCYAFSGAGQTGRFSSRGAQVHNMVRDPVEKGNPDRALDAMDDIIAEVDARTLADTYNLSPSRLLARLIRPTFIAASGKQLVWADYDQIEARVLPWLAGTHDADAKLQLFRDGVDVYKIAAGAIFNESPDNIDDKQRQVGKVAELALGFGGAAGAFNAMARGYGVAVERDAVKLIVDTWREQNYWCKAFWYKLWDAAIGAYLSPGVWVHAGRVRYAFAPGLMGGTLVCELPCGRWLVYPGFRQEDAVRTDPETGEKIPYTRTSFIKGYSKGGVRVDIWYGVLAENITQGFAASCLRRALCEVSDVCVLHTHDEIVLEVPEADVKQWSQWLVTAMVDIEKFRAIPGYDRLPITASVETGPYYTK